MNVQRVLNKVCGVGKMNFLLIKQIFLANGLIKFQTFLPRTSDGRFILSGDDVLADGGGAH